MSKFDPTVTIVGRIGTDPEVKSGSKGSYINFRLKRDFRDRDGNTTYTKWYSVNLDGDHVPANLTKGATIEVRGTQSVKPGTDKDGNNVTYYSVRTTAADISAPRMGKNGQPLERFVISGGVGREPTKFTSKAGREYYKFSLAHNYSVRTEDGQWEDFKVWYNVVMFTDSLPDFITTGALIEVAGVDEIRSYYSEKYSEQREDCSVRAFEASVVDRDPAAKANREPVAAGAPSGASVSNDTFEAPF